MSDITPLGKTNWRDANQIFGIREKDRFGHIYALGKTGTGKSTLLLNMAIADMEAGNGLCVIDPHGDLAETLLNHVPERRIRDVLYVDTTDKGYAIGFNPLFQVDPSKHHLLASELIATFKKHWSDSWGPRLEHVLRFTLLSLLQYPGSTLLDIHSLLTNHHHRERVVSSLQDSHLRSFWFGEFEKYPPALRAEIISPILNKVGLFQASPVLRHMVGQEQSAFHLRDMMDTRKILICNLAKGSMGEEAASLLGGMLITAIHMAALQRSDAKESERVPFFLYVDEVHSFITRSFADLVSEVRKYKVGIFLTHQYLDQLPDNLQTAILGNVGTIISFRIGAADAEVLAGEFFPRIKAADFVSLPRHSMYLRLQIDGFGSKPFSADSLPILHKPTGVADLVKIHSRKSYGVPITKIAYALEKHQFNLQKPPIQSSLFPQDA